MVQTERGSGILLHISSLPSAYGIGDLGNSARVFADFLQRSGQKYWQLLPLNPTEQGQGFSPYSALSSKAGWPVYISVNDLVKEGFLIEEDIRTAELPSETSVDYTLVERTKMRLLAKAFENFVQQDSLHHQAFFLFCEKEKHWLDDFTLFQLLKIKHEGLPWFNWTDEYKKRNAEALENFSTQHRDELQKLKWYQYIFNIQWTALKGYCNRNNTKLIGDIPFYVSYDSADVWSAQHLFSLDNQAECTGVAGVPPDAFSDDGQLWGMPTFNWQAMEADGYQWWIERLRRNVELFNITRLDHFRAFAAYWKVPAGSTTAISGQWIIGPGKKFFEVIKKEFPKLPFVAEDLGDIDDDVLNLRDEYDLPGMKVLQFAFDHNMARNPYMPHNYDKNFLVYTGTHDNNTTIGWWKTQPDLHVHRLLEHYTGQIVNEGNAHIIMMRLAYASVAKIAIVPMQDVLGLDEKSRMNTPSSSNGNWVWRMMPHQLNADAENLIRGLTEMYNR
jgi:4-alpha-glucanotransferase